MRSDTLPTAPGIRDALRWGADQIRASGVESPSRDARILLRHVLDCSEEELASRSQAELPVEVVAAFCQLIARRQEREPIAYITGRREFMGLEFTVDRSVLIPRPESELLVEKVVDLFTAGAAAAPGSATHLSAVPRSLIADIGTGSGAIGVSIAKLLPQATVYATDVSADALEVARRNAAVHDVSDRMIFSQGTYLTALPKPVHVIACNPPYIPESEIPRLDRDVRDFEPILALSGGSDGLDAYRSMIPLLSVCLLPGGSAFFEIGFDHAAPLRDLAGRFAFGARFDVFQDLAGFDRVLRLAF